MTSMRNWWFNKGNHAQTWPDTWCYKSREPVDRYSGSRTFSYYSHDLIHPFGGDLITRNPRPQFPQPSRSPLFPPCGGARSVECWCWLLKRQRCQDVSWYCWWKKSCTTLHVWNPVNIGRNYINRYVLYIGQFCDCMLKWNDMLRIWSMYDTSWNSLLLHRFL